MFQVLFTRSAQKDIKQLPTFVKKQLQKKILFFADDPLLYARKLTNSSIGEYRWRVGNYRVVFDCVASESKVVVLRVKHRSSVYK